MGAGESLVLTPVDVSYKGNVGRSSGQKDQEREKDGFWLW